jgi:hypothetical protein
VCCVDGSLSSNGRVDHGQQGGWDLNKLDTSHTVHQPRPTHAQ